MYYTFRKGGAAGGGAGVAEYYSRQGKEGQRMAGGRRGAATVVIRLAPRAEAGGGVAAQIVQALTAAMAGGELAAGARLPSTRMLARQLGVNPLTVAAAYRRLAAAGLVAARVGSGTRVSPLAALPPPPAGGGGGAGDPVAARFPLERLRRIMDQVLATAGAAAFGYDDPGGLPEFKAAVCAYLAGRGIAAAAERLVVISGAQQGLSVLVQALIRRGDWVLVERPTYPGMLRLLQRAGAQVEGVDLTPEGPDLRVVERLFQTRPVRLFYTMPAYHNPTGFCQPPAVMDRLLELCRRHGVTLVEDDAGSDLDYGLGRPPGFAQRAAPGDDLIHLKSFSQLLLPGLRLGFCLAPERTAALLRQVKQESDLMTSGFFQRVLCQFLANGWFDDWLRELEALERERFAALLAVAAGLREAGFQVAPSRGGLRLWVRLPPGTAAERFLATATARALPVRGAAEFATDGAALGDWFVLNAAGFAATALPALARALAACR